MLHRGRDGDAAGENKLAAVTADLREERAARLKFERALEEANTLIQSLRTKLKHTEMSWDEKLRDEREARAQVDALLLTEREARTQAEAKAAEAALALSLLERATPAIAEAVPPPNPQAEPRAPLDLFEETQAQESAASPVKRRPVKKTKAAPEPSLPLEVESDEEQPIEWWLPSFRATRGTPARKKRAAR
jgi:chromosome segregation ATPase